MYMLKSNWSIGIGQFLIIMMNGQSVVDWAVYAGSLHLEAERLPPATAR